MASRDIVLDVPRAVRRRLKRLSQQTGSKTIFRRCQIVLRVAAGERASAIAIALACSYSTVNRTLRAFRERGEASLIPQPSPGRPRKVTSAHEQALDRTLAQEPRQMKQAFSNWTSRNLANYLKLAVHATTILRHLWALGWHWGRPVRRVASPDPRYRPKAKYLRRLERAAQRGVHHLYYADEFDIALLPTVSGRWMRVGHQHQVNTPGQNQKQYGFGAANFVTGQLVWLLWPNKNNVGFRHLLKALLEQHAHDSRKIVVVLDNYRIHKTQAVQRLLSKVRDRLRLYFLPTYSPRLNRIEHVWRHFRQNVTDNFYFKTMSRLLRAVEAFLSALAKTPQEVLTLLGRA